MNINALQSQIFDEDHLTMFLEHSGWVKGKPVGQDSSIRRYFRVSKGKEKAILMETVPDHSPHATPGHRISDFVKISNWLNEIGLNASVYLNFHLVKMKKRCTCPKVRI